MIIIAWVTISYCVYTLLAMLKLAIDMFIAWHEYQDGKRYDLIKWSHQYSYFDCLIWVRSL